MAKKKDKGKNINIKNPNSYRNYDITETFEAGITLKGSEVKSIRLGNCNIKDSFASIRNGEIFLHNMYIKPYEYASGFNPDPTRKRKLLMHKLEIMRLEDNIKKNNLNLIPIKIYFKHNLVKLQLGIGKGKKLYDKRYDLAKRDAKRKVERMKNRYL